MDENVKVSIYCRTYNHKTYIQNALDGILMQETDFPYKVIVFDDASTDGTSDIVKDYAERYPQIIQAFIMEENTWHSPDRAKVDSEFMQKYLTGKYIGYCEGDDFWIDPHKLQMQVDYMESHPDCVLYLHNALWFNCIDHTMKTGNPYSCKSEKDISAEELLMMYNGHPPTASILHKRELVSMPLFFRESSVGDYPLLLYALSCGNVHYNNRIMSVYRQMADGSYNNAMQTDQYFLFYYFFGISEFCVKYNNYTNYKYEKWCNKKIHDFSSPIIHDRKRSQSIDDYIKTCMERGYFFSKDFFVYADKLKCLQKQIYDKTFISIELKCFLNQYKYIVIMGAGNYASILAEQFFRNCIEYNGFAVSQKMAGNDFYLGKPVWKLSELPYNRDDTGVVIGIDPVDWCDIKTSLNNANILNYYCPFLLGSGK